VIKGTYNKDHRANWIVQSPYSHRPMSTVDVNRILVRTEGSGCVEKCCDALPVMGM